jgi:hypothetical protein
MPTSQIRPVAAPSQLTLLLGGKMTAVASLAEARARTLAFIREHDIIAGEFGDLCGRIWLDDVPYARVSFHGRLWALDEHGRETYRAMSDSGEVAP